MRKFIFLLFLLPAMAFTTHEFYLSVTEIEYKSEKKELQIISRIFVDDIEKVLQQRYNPDIYLNKEKEHPNANAYLEKYINQRLKIAVNGESRSLQFIGKKYDRDLLILFIKIGEVPPIRTISVENKILTGLFPSQKNVVHVEFHGRTKSLLLTRDEEKGMLKFD